MLHLNFNPFPELFTDRLHLRSMTDDDIVILYTIRSNPEINKYINRTDSNTKKDIKQFMDRINKGIKEINLIFWIINLKGDKSAIGSIVLWNINKETKQVELGYELLPQYHSQGIMTEAIGSILDYGLNLIDAKAIVALTHDNNSRSLSLLAKFKFKLKTELIDGEMKKYYYLDNPDFASKYNNENARKE